MKRKRLTNPEAIHFGFALKPKTNDKGMQGTS